MTAPRVTPAGMLVLRVEVDPQTLRVLIHVRTVDDLTRPRPGLAERSFVDADAAAAHADAWLTAWIADAVTQP